MGNRKTVRNFALMASVALLAIGCAPSVEGNQVKAEGLCAGGTIVKDRTFLVGHGDMQPDLYVTQQTWLPPLPDTIGLGSGKKFIRYEIAPPYSEWFRDNRLQPGEWYEPNKKSNGTLKIRWARADGLGLRPEGEIVIPMISTENIQVCVVRDKISENYMDSYYIRESQAGKER